MSDERQPPPLSDAWREAFARLLAEKHADEPAQATRSGCWCIRFDWIMSSYATILVLLPGDYDRIHEYWEEMCDWSGECVEFESESAVYACDAERAIFSFTEHWQAGLGGSVTVYPTDDAYRAAREEAMRKEDEDDAD
jgi:hypothetical protein